MRPNDMSNPEIRRASASKASSKPLSGMLVVALEQAVAAPYCSSRLADAGARVIKIERPEGDFARGYDRSVHGQASYFVWINRGKESVALDLKQAPDLAILERMIASADIFVQNLAPGAAARLGLGSSRLRQRHPRLITCDISGYGEHGTQQEMKAYDLLVQAESGLISVSGAPGEWGRIGVSLCDITAGMNALLGIHQALLQRALTGRGSGVRVSLFDSAAELMSVPYLLGLYGGRAPSRVGLKHPSITPYGVFTCVDGLVAQVFGSLGSGEIIDRLTAAGTAYGNVNSVHDLIEHPQLRTRPMPVGGFRVRMPASPWQVEWEDADYAPAPGINEHGAALREEFAAIPTPAF